MSYRITLAALALLAGITGCSEPTTPAPSSGDAVEAAGPAAGSPATADERTSRERLARRFAVALADADFRAKVKAQLDRSPVREQKVHFQRFLRAEGRTALRAMARLSREVESAVETDASHSLPLEVYFPVPTHRARWSGDSDVLVATAREDGDIPVAFDARGRRHILSATKPPATPVLAVVPVETDFDSPTTAPLICCAGGPAPTSPPGLYMTSSHFVQEFEGWLKGSPEFEVHILGQSGKTDSLTTYQCAGEHASGYYAFDQNKVDWAGSVLLFSQQQLNSYKSQHPSQNFRILVLEDDDGACAIRFDNNRFKNLMTVLQASYPNLTGSKDSSFAGLGRIVKRANALQKILRAAYSFITSQDDLVGNAIEDVVAGEFYPGANWIVKGESNATNGWLKLQMR
ncbi:MAG: hypothetical protein ACREL3_13210 [Gemmatimonadales bacterium]